MTAIRGDILMNTDVRASFLNGIKALDNEFPGPSTSDLVQFVSRNNIPLQMRGKNQEVSTYDLFVFWHVIAMAVSLPPGNAAHSGPIFLPWHRMYLIQLEQNLQRVLDDADFGLPYWNWAQDGELAREQQWQASLWSDSYLGEARGPVRSGELKDFRVRMVHDVRTNTLVSVEPREVMRAAGLDDLAPDLPTKADVRDATGQVVYDQPPWSRDAVGHRNMLEGWIGGPKLHNRVHVWIGGDMAPGSSPNDPAFFLNHCNVDRIWEAWMANNGLVYQPRSNQGPNGHRIDSTMLALIGAAMTPQQILDPSAWYSYDNLSLA